MAKQAIITASTGTGLPLVRRGRSKQPWVSECQRSVSLPGSCLLNGEEGEPQTSHAKRQRTGRRRAASGTSRVTSCLAAHIFTHLQLCPPDFLFSAAFGFVCCPQNLSFCYTALPRHGPYIYAARLLRSSTFIANGPRFSQYSVQGHLC